MKNNYFGTIPIKEITVGNKPVVLHAIQVYGKGDNEYSHQIFRITNELQTTQT